jgi:hypothetical protein
MMCLAVLGDFIRRVTAPPGRIPAYPLAIQTEGELAFSSPPMHLAAMSLSAFHMPTPVKPETHFNLRRKSEITAHHAHGGCNGPMVEDEG